MLSNGDPAVSVVVVEDSAVVIASDDNDGDMQAPAKSKRKLQKHQFSWEYVKDWTGVSKRVGTALFEYLKRSGRDVVTRLFNVVSDNGLDVITIITRLF
ncbi:unnamed protein product [Sphagnum tenellum]